MGLEWEGRVGLVFVAIIVSAVFTSLKEGRAMLGYGSIAKGRVDDVGISLKVSKVRTTEDQRRDASVWSCGDA